jgi:DNA modification methylase
VAVDYRVGDTRDVIATIPAGSVSLVACSPPFLALRSYLPADHPDKHAEIGSEPDPGTFLDTLLALTADWGRVLAPWGSIAIELGDTFAGSGGAGGDYNDGGLRQGQNGFTGSARRDKVEQPRQWSGGNGWPRPKCLALIPQAYAMSLAYGRNIITGAESPAGQWLVRNMIVWHRPNPAVGALGDKFRPCTSYITVATRSPKRWFDLTAVRTTPTQDPSTYSGNGYTKGNPAGNGQSTPMAGNPAGAPPLDAWFDEHDTWTVTTQPSSLAHYAMWPAKLAERLILSMCPAEVCTSCGEPRRRIEQPSAKYSAIRGAVGDFKAGRDRGTGLNGHTQYHNGEHTEWADNITTGWTDCGCGVPFTPGVVLDPFAGTGTTLAVADLHGRDAIGIDIDPRNPLLYDQRRAECARNLFGTQPEMPGQLDMFDGAA